MTKTSTKALEEIVSAVTAGIEDSRDPLGCRAHGSPAGVGGSR
jgi:hypothetical protein